MYSPASVCILSLNTEYLCTHKCMLYPTCSLFCVCIGHFPDDLDHICALFMLYILFDEATYPIIQCSVHSPYSPIPHLSFINPYLLLCVLCVLYYHCTCLPLSASIVLLSIYILFPPPINLNFLTACSFFIWIVLFLLLFETIHNGFCSTVCF